MRWTSIVIAIVLWLLAGLSPCMGQEVEWTSIFGRDASDYISLPRTVRQAEDGGFIVAFSSEVPPQGPSDICLVKTDSHGDTLWLRTYENGYSDGLATTFDGGVVITGYDGSNGRSYLLKTDSLGNTEWNKPFSWTVGRSVQQTRDSGYIFTGNGSSGQADVFLAKTDSVGNLLWSKLYGGEGGDQGFAIEETSDYGFIIAGYTHSFGQHIWIIKTDSLGDSLWSIMLGSGFYAHGLSVCESVINECYYVAGKTAIDSYQLYVAAIGYEGNAMWETTYGDEYFDQANSIIATTDGGAILTGIYQTEADNQHPYIMRIYSTGDTVWTTWLSMDYAIGWSIESASVNEYVVAGYMTIYETKGNSSDIFLVKIYDKTPIISHIAFDGDTIHQNVIEHTPIISWDFYDNDLYAQDSFEIDIGIDTEWSVSEIWDPLPYEGIDTFITYAGAPLTDGETYHMRIRVKNGIYWSEWYETSFRMNSVPTTPVQISPIDYAIVDEEQPTLWVLNSTDAEGDELFYDFVVLVDCVLVAGSNIPQQMDSTGWQVDIPLDDNMLHHWDARVHDGYEYSDPSTWEYFLVNAVEEYPAAFDLQYPPDTGWSQVCDFPIGFEWQESSDPDPMDSVFYRLLVAIDDEFTFVATYDSIFQTIFEVLSLDYGTHYWWKVYAIDTKGNTTECNGVADFLTWILGDANQDGAPNVGDAVFLINYVFTGGPEPIPLKVGDINGDCEVNVGDAVNMISYIFRGGDPPNVGCANK